MRFYIKYVPNNKGMNRVEYIQEFLTYSTVQFTNTHVDGMHVVGYLEGEGDDLSHALTAIEGRFSTIRMTEQEYLGSFYLNFNFYNGPETEPPENDPSHNLYIPPEQRPNPINILAEKGFTVTESQLLQYAKEYKISLMKEILKRKFLYDNDSISSLAQAVTGFILHYNDMTTEEKQTMDNLINRLKNIYTKEICIQGFQEMLDLTESNLPSYYQKKQLVLSATNLEQIKSIQF